MIAHTENPLTFRPRLVLAYADSVQASLTCRHLRRLGWEVRLASSGPEARNLVHILAPDVVLLDTELRDESGWLTCAKLRLEHPEQIVVLVTSELTDRAQDFARFVGATSIVSRTVTPVELVEEVQHAAA
jgi:CheY-like chemotaxis protein